MKLVNKKITWAILFISALALENFCWSTPYYEYLIDGIFKYSDIGIVLALGWCIYVFVLTKNIFNRKAMIWPAVFIVIAIISHVAGYFYFGQSIFLGIRQIRYLLVCLLYFYATYNSLAYGLLDKEDVYKAIRYVAILEIVLYFAQYFLIDRIVFLEIGATFEYGDARFRISFLFPLIQMYISINELLNGRNRVQNAIIAILGAAVLAVLCKHRAPTLFMLCSFGAALLLWKKNLTAKLIVSGIVLVAIICYISNSHVIQSAFYALFETENPVYTLDIRHAGRLYYFDQLTAYKAWITGFGQPNSNCQAAFEASGALKGIFAVDNGIFGVLYEYGLLGVVWVFVFYADIIRRSFVLYRDNNQYHFLLYIIFEIGNLYIGMHWFFYYAAAFMIFMALLNWEYDENKQKREAQ